MALEDEALLRELHSGLAVAQNQQTEINRRLANIERKLDTEMVDPDRVTALEESNKERKSWLDWTVRTLGQVLLVAALVYLGKLAGLELKP